MAVRLSEGGAISSRSHRPGRPGRRTAVGAAAAVALALATAPAAGAQATKVTVRQDADAVTVAVTGGTGYEVRLERAPFAIATSRAGATVFRTAGGDHGGLRFSAGGSGQRATGLVDARWDGAVLRAELATTSAAHRIARGRDRGALDGAREDVTAERSTVAVKVVRQDGSGPIGKAGSPSATTSPRPDAEATRSCT